MSSALSTLGPSVTSDRPALLSWAIAITLGSFVAWAGLATSVPLSVFGPAAAFLVFAVESDVRRHRIPNLLTLPAFALAMGLGPVFGASDGYVGAAAGAALGLALLVVPYAVGGLGAGDVKALMVLGAWLGPATLLGATVWAAISGGVLAVLLLLWRRELGGFVRRWMRVLNMSLFTKSVEYEAPAKGSAAAGGIPFAAPIAAGLAIQLLQGAPW